MPYPLCSIVIPTFDRQKQLGDCLNALAALDYPRERFEVIVVDDGSRIPPEPVLAAFQSRLTVRLVCSPHNGPAAARNMGAQKAEGELLAFMDDDCVPASNWLKAMATSYQQGRDCMLGGWTVNQLRENPYASASQLLIDYLYEYYNAVPNQSCFITSTNLAVPTDLFRHVGGFDESFRQAAAEDREFCDRWASLGYEIAMVPEAVVYHSHPLGLSTFWDRHFRYGEGAWQYRRIRARRCRQPVSVEPPVFYVRLLGYPFRQRRFPDALCLSFLFMLSQLANAAGFIHARSRSAESNAK